MIGYQARWDNSPLKADALTMFARTTGPVAPPTSAPTPASHHEHPSDTGAAGATSSRDDIEPVDADRPYGSNADLSAEPEPTPASPSNLPSDLPPNAPCETLPAAADDFSDLLALADSCVEDPLLQIGREPLPLEEDGLDSVSLRVADEADATDPLAALALEYRHALLSQRSDNPHQLKTTTSDGSGPVIRVPHDTFAELTSHSQPEASVVDLLIEGKNVDTLLEGLDTFGAGQIFEANQAHEILALLAPHGLSARRPNSTAQLARAEHHMVSVDSYMPMPNSIEDEAPQIADEHDH